MPNFEFRQVPDNRLRAGSLYRKTLLFGSETIANQFFELWQQTVTTAQLKYWTGAAWSSDKDLKSYSGSFSSSAPKTWNGSEWIGVQ